MALWRPRRQATGGVEGVLRIDSQELSRKAFRFGDQGVGLGCWDLGREVDSSGWMGISGIPKPYTLHLREP